MKIKITKIFLIKIFLLLLIINISKCSNFNEISIKEKNENQIRSLEDDTSDYSSEEDSNSSEEESTSTTTPTTTTTIVENGGNSTNAIIKKSSSGLSTGTICAIAIPCIAALLGAAIAAAVLKGGSTASPAIGTAFNSSLSPNIISNSLDKLNVIDKVPIDPQPQPQPQPVVTQQIIQPKPVEVQPVQRIIRPTYHKLDPPAVNNVFKPKIPQTQQIQMVPVQQVQMVPVQQVQVVPVQQIQTVPVQQMQTVPVQQIQTAPVQQEIPVSQVTETLPHITPVSEDIPQTIVGQEVISGHSEMISDAPLIDGGITQVTQTSQVLPMQVLPTIEHGTQVLPSQVLPTIDQGTFPTNSIEGIDFSLNNQI